MTAGAGPRTAGGPAPHRPVLVTGGTGFIGSRVVARLAATGTPVVRGGPPPELGLPAGDDDGPAAVPVDVTDVDALVAVLREHRVGGIVHLAAPSIAALAAPTALLEPVRSVLAVLEAARLAGVERVTVASSLEVYAGLTSGPCTEDDALPVASPTALAAAKKAAEVLGDAAARATGTDLVSLRLGFVYGPGYRSMVNLPSRVAHAVARGRSLGPDTAGRLGEDLDLIHVDDCAAAVVRVATTRRRRHRVYNVGTGRLTSAGAVFTAAGLAPPPPGDPGQGRPQTPVMDVGRIREEFGFVAAHDMASGMRDYLAWLATHEF